jgi:hypothetical protein
MIEIHQDARSASGLPIAASWCRGLAGVARALVGAGKALASDRLIRRGRELLVSAIEWIPRLDNLTACCGVAGVTSAAIDVAEMLRDERASLDAIVPALEAVRLRSSRRDELDQFSLNEGEAPLSLGLGVAGVLHLLWRIDVGGPGFIPSPLVALCASR